MAVIKVTINASKGSAKLSMLGKDIKTAAEKSVVSLAYKGKEYAKSIAPRATGRLASFIKVRKGNSENGLFAQVQAQNPTLNPPKGYRRSNVTKFNLVKYMHEKPGAYKWGNDPTFMFTTRDYLSKEKKKTAVAKFAKITTKYK